MKNLFCILFVGLFICSCQENTSNTESTTASDTTISSNSSPSEKSQSGLPFFVIKTETDDTDIPRSTVYLSMDGRELEIAEALNCEKIEAKDYETHKIPKDAIDACGGWWAGSGDYFYLIKPADKNYWTVMQAINDEQQTTEPYSYQNFMNVTMRKN